MGVALSSLPFHPFTNLQALGFTKRGLPIWPVMGGSEDAGADDGAGSGQQDAGQGGQQQSDGADKGFPEGTPVAQMSDAQKAAYYKHQNRQADNKLAAFHGFTPQDVNSLWTRVQELEAERLTADERAQRAAAEQAATEARAAVEAELRPKLLASQLKSVAAPIFGGDQEKLNAWLDGVDPARFTGEDGDIDEARVTNHLSALVTPPNGNQFLNRGQHSGPPPATQPGQAGRAEAQRRREQRVYT